MLGALLAFLLAAIFAGGIAFVAMPYLTGEARADKRMQALAQGRAARVDPEGGKRKSIAEALKKAEEARSQRQNPSLETRLRQTGLEVTKPMFLMFCAAAGLVSLILVFSFTGSIWIGLLGMAAGALGIPNWIIGFLTKRRMAKFTAEFPGSLDLISRGIKAGLPLNECLKIVANEAPEPIGPEFQSIIESQQMGLTLAQAIERMAERTPSSEANFFAIAVAIQQKSGGNLAEALGNLSRILRERKQMKMKIKAMSTEATASAAIIACMPPGVGLMVFITSPDYISLLWTTTTGQVTMMISAVWMGLGVVVMRKMINFDI